MLEKLLPKRNMYLPKELARLERRLLRQVAVANIVGGTALGFFHAIFFASELPVTTRSAFAILVGVCIFSFLLVLALSYHLIRPLIRWLAHSDGTKSAPQRVQIAVVIQPFVLTAITLTLWTLSAFGFGVVQAFADGSSRSFLTTFAATMLAALIVAAIVYLRVERVWRPWVPRFFADNDPTNLPLPRVDLLRARLQWAFLLGSAIPLLAIAVAVTFRLEEGFTETNTEIFVWTLAIAGLIAAAVLSINIRRSITAPVYSLQDAMQKVREGDLDIEVPVDRIDELGRLQQGFNEMVDGLRTRNQLADLLDRQVGAPVAERSLNNGVALGGETRVVTALFVDLQAFSSMAEELAPSEVATILNTVFEVIVEAVTGASGIVNKFQGDAVLAIFGAPHADDRQAAHALEAAAKIARELEAIDIAFGIGIATGEVFAGNVGTEDRFEYTVIGDPVNIAARLQELTRQVGRRILLTGRTADFARKFGGRVVGALVPMEAVELRGRTKPTPVFSLSPTLWRGAQVDPDESGEADTGDARAEVAAEAAEPEGFDGDDAALGALERAATSRRLPPAPPR